MDTSPPNQPPEERPDGSPVPGTPPAVGPRQGPPPIPSLPSWKVRRRRERRRFRPLLLVGSILLGVMASLVTVAYFITDRDHRPFASEAVEDFVECLCLGEAGRPETVDDPEALCGYALAYDMLSESIREEVPYGMFYDEFASITERHGPVQKMEQTLPKRRSRLARRYRYRLWFGAPDAGLDEHKTFMIEVTVTRGKESWVITSYKIQPTSEQEIR